MKVTDFEIEDDKVNEGQKMLIAIAEDGSKWVVGGNLNFSLELVPYDKCANTKE